MEIPSDIATAEEVLKFLTHKMRYGEKESNQIEAAKLLAKRYGLLVNVNKHEVSGDLRQVLSQIAKEIEQEQETPHR